MPRAPWFACSLLLAALPALADDPPKPAPKKPKPAPQKPAPAPKPPARVAHEAVLARTQCHFAFRRAPLGDVLEALRRATKVPIELGKSAKKVLEKRRFKIKYVADRTGLQVLRDLAKAAALDFVVTDAGVVMDTKSKIKRLRKRLGIAGKTTRLTAKDVKRMLVTKEVSLSANKKPLSRVLSFLRKETGIRFVTLTGKDPAPKISLHRSATPLGQLLGKLLHPVGYGWLRQGSVVLVGPREEIDRLRKKRKKKKKKKKKK